MKRLYIYYPVLFLILLFGLDKLFLLHFFDTQFTQAANPVYYQNRKMLFERLKSDPEIQERNLALAFGDSRAYAISNQGLPESDQRNWLIYNFSGPQSVPAYALYWFENILNAGIRPKLVFLVVSPEAFSDSNGLFENPTLRYGLDPDFVWKNWDHIPWRTQKEFLLNQLFAIRTVDPNLKLLWDRLLNGHLNEYDPAQNMEMLILNHGHGEQLAYATLSNDEKKLAIDSERIRNVYLRNFHVDDTQFYFLEEILKKAQHSGTQVYLIWPRVYGEYRKYYDELDLKNQWWSRVEKLGQQYGMKSKNMNEILSCDLFYDSSHQSAFCIKEELELIMRDFHSNQ